MKEDIEKMQDFVMLLRAEPEDNPKAFLEIDYESQKELAQAIENLINKYKELEKECDDIYADYQDLGKEKLQLEEHIEEYNLNVKEAMHEAQENARLFRKEQAKKNEYKKMVELMADSLSDGAFYMDDASEYCEVKKKECDCYQNKLGCKECLLDYFRKKAKGE